MERTPEYSSLRDESILDRIESVDIIRGLIMVIMALDHVRDFFHVSAFTADPLDPETTTAWLFFTRWVTHFCAPSFLLLSGISAGLSGRKRGVPYKANFLIKRGFWLVVAELAIVTLALSFDLTYKVFFLQVIWAIGWSMVLLGIFIRFLNPRYIGVLGLLLIFGHNALDFVRLPENSVLSVVVNILLTSSGKFYTVGNTTFAVLYAILPWSGIMFLGYGLSELYSKGFPIAQRKRILVAAGMGAVVMFVVLRSMNVYGDPIPWAVRSDFFKSFLAFVNVTKYPPSLQYSLVTLGPVLLLLALAEQWEGRLTRILIVYGRVPFFYFVVHFYLIHTLSAVVVLLSGYSWHEATDPSLFFQFRPPSFGFELGGVYLFWMGVVAVMYPLSLWFGRFKSRNSSWWLGYL